uniref:Copine Va n=1 Tax=Neolamprologus brichardi TaxID=32507 RepID=A0A3Q4MJ14_NEOBR
TLRPDEQNQLLEMPVTFSSLPSPFLFLFGRTEVIDNTLNPDFVRKYILDYFFEEKQNLRFDVYDIDSKSPDLAKHDFLGQVFCTLGEIVGSPASRLEKPAHIKAHLTCFPVGKPTICVCFHSGIPGKKCGTVILSAEELGNCRDYATMQFCANKLDKKDFFGKSDPFMVFYRSNEDGTFTICHKTEVVKNTLNPVWEPFSIPVRFTLSLSFVPILPSYQVVNAKKKIKKKRYINSGTVSLRYCKSKSPCALTLTSLFLKGNPSQSTSLHYMNPYQMNAYAMALKAVGEIIQDYDSDKMFPALGFGAKLPPDWRVSHEFPLNGNVDNPYCNGMEGILEAYHQSLKTVQLYGPTNFAPVVNHVARYQRMALIHHYKLLVTANRVSAQSELKSCAAKLPMSIIIVGVGQAEFDVNQPGNQENIASLIRGFLKVMCFFLMSQQFVPFRDYMDRTGNHVLSMARLAKDVLAEIPDQLISYMKSRAIKPNPVPVYSPTPPRPHTQSSASGRARLRLMGTRLHQHFFEAKMLLRPFRKY